MPLSRSQLKALVCLMVRLVTIGFKVSVGSGPSTSLKSPVSMCAESEGVGCLEDLLTERLSRAMPREGIIGKVGREAGNFECGDARR